MLKFIVVNLENLVVVVVVVEIADLLGGVVQGSGLGPVLFLVFIDGLAKVLERFGVVTKFFADDVKVYLRIVKSDDCVILQKALDVISCWASDWQLKVSVEKCNMLHIGSCSVSYQYSVGHDVISHETQCKDRCCYNKQFVFHATYM